MRIGIKSVSMDDIARELGISKKTIYKHFKDKKELISNVIKFDIDQEKCLCEDCYNSTENAVQQMIDISRHISHSHKDVNPTVIYDLQKYYPEEWAIMENFRNDFVRSAILKNIEKGRLEGLYRTDIEPDIIALIYITLISGMMLQLTKSDNDYNFVTLHRQMVSYHLSGICNQNGREYLEQHINEITNE